MERAWGEFPVALKYDRLTRGLSTTRDRSRATDLASLKMTVLF